MVEIPVLYSFARSGGTLVNQLLGVHPQCLVLSEVNPTASFKSIQKQGLEWLGLIEKSYTNKFVSMPYHEQIKFLYDQSTGKGKKLIIRDWVSVNFLPGCSGPEIKPSGELEQAFYLGRSDLRPLPLVIVRKGEAVYKSIQRNLPRMEGLSLKTFSESYLKYAYAVAEFPKIKLESLRSQPASTIREILNRFDLSSDETSFLLENFFNFKNCTGNTSLKKVSKSSLAQKILPPENNIESTSHPKLIEANKILGYDK
mgnify:CR=1 FL=1